MTVQKKSLITQRSTVKHALLAKTQTSDLTSAARPAARPAVHPAVKATIRPAVKATIRPAVKATIRGGY